MDHIASLLLGLGAGGVYAALALALVITYRASGVLNFATGAMALYVAYTYAGLRRGELLVPIPGLPKTIDLGQELGFWPAVLISMVVAAVLGAALRAGVPPVARCAPAGQGGGIARSPGDHPGHAGHPPGHQRGERAGHLPRRALGVERRDRAVRSVLPGSHRRRAGAPRGGRVPVHALRAADARHRRIADGAYVSRLARPHRAGQLDDQRHGRRHRRHPHRSREPADAGDVHAVRRPRWPPRWSGGSSTWCRSWPPASPSACCSPRRCHWSAITRGCPRPERRSWCR